jgi:hypothetical protein
MRFFFERARPQEFLHVVLVSQSLVALRAEFSFVLFFGGFHPSNGNVCPERAIEFSLEARPCIIRQPRNWLAHVAQLLLPARRVAFFRFRHANKNPFAFLVRFAFGQIAVDLRSFDLGAPVFLDHFKSFAFGRGGHRFGYRNSSASANSIPAGTIFLERNCCAVMTTATEPTMRVAPAIDLPLNFSCAKSVPRMSATTGLT